MTSPRPSRRRWPTLAAVVALVAGTALVPTPAWALPPTPTDPPRAAITAGTASDVRELQRGQSFDSAKLGRSTAQQRRQAARAAAGTPAVGTTRTLVGLDDTTNTLYPKPYTLQAVGDKIEVWVADDTAFPAGDCRNAVPGSTTVTRAQAETLAAEFDRNIFPKESAAFSVAPDRDGSKATAGIDATGDGDKVMTLVDNVRDDSYYGNAPTYIAGFFFSTINELLDRNVMTIDAFDWAHRTGANPPDEPTSDACTSRSAQPRLYEGTFAHEYQHLLHYYTDPDEATWLNEGLSDFAQTLVGYVDARKTVFEPGSDGHITCYQGFNTVRTAYNPNPSDCGGPENSLTLWGDQPGGGSILADYGAAYSFLLFLYDRYGLGFVSQLHRDGRDQGLVGVQRVLDGYAPGTDVLDVVHDFQTSTLLDRVVEGRKGKVAGIAKSRVTSASLSSTVNLGNPRSYAEPGAPANGADYVGVRAASGLYLKGNQLRSLRFAGAKTLTPDPLRWSSVSDAPGRAGNATLFSGDVPSTDATALTSVTVPTSDPTLTLTERHQIEKDFDYGYVVVSADGGRTYTALANANTVTGPLGPALTGSSTGFATQRYDLSAWAGRQVLLGFRYVTDPAVNEGGWWIDDVTVGGTTVSDGSSLTAFRSATQVRPLPVAGFAVRVIGLDTARKKALVRSYTARSFTLGAARLAAFRSYPRVVVIIGYDEPTETLATPATYTLTVNGVVQPGGGASSDAVRVAADRF
ncbi:ribosomal protein L21E [Friedmanniella endophytica]|uniref:Ribosomal protein L21E n=1 Tax=Microlunatus kandeliicorticis TaxID=1759536 RepID=A0A7W3IT08_9ACTN|nr:immune inhibitor A domain-containing protein [Microlunatus kandeliicorticis]MBA8794673.1 ribosomal protein L21E [Microlunatus kandeliicorticis]